jgi:sugar lactone lactonase YvrE/thiol-disulfide isomerase/thioredoxin
MRRLREFALLAGLLLVATSCSGASETTPSETGGTATTSTASTAAAPTTGDGTDDAPGGEAGGEQVSFAGTQPAPEFPAGLDWLNTGGPLTLEALKGKVVLLDFWTYGCINCIHIIPDLKRLEAEYPDELVVIGVHSAKFLNEGDTENIRNVILRYELEHPVVNDRDFEVWRTWGANAWPTTVLIDPAGNVVGGHSGEGVYQIVEPVVASLVAEFDELGLLDRTPLPVIAQREVRASTPLAFPGKVLATKDRLYIADSGNHRIVVSDLAGEVLEVYGDGNPGLRNGPGFEARFHAPQGMALSADGSTLYVADTNNHAIRAVDLAGGVVTTYAGDGRIGWPPSPGTVPDVGLNSPWDVELRDGVLYVAMAGHHQLWSIDVETGAAGPLVGNAAEGVRNGPLADAELAQPSALEFDGSGLLYFADSESSAVRTADVLGQDGMTGIVAGSNENLFDFGDVDGPAAVSRLQHPLGLAYYAPDNVMLVADTYNSKIKRIDIEGALVETYLGAQQGWADGTDPRFYEPGGLSILGDTLYVADTNNHAIRMVDLASGDTTTLVLSGIERFAPAPDDADYRGTVVRLEPQTVAAGAGALRLDITLPPGHKVNEQASSAVTWSVTGGVAAFAAGADRSLTGATFPVEVGADFVEGSGEVTADVVVVHCAETAESLCFIKQLRFVVPLEVSGSGSSAVIPLPYEITLPRDS